MTLVPDSYADAAITPARERLTGILVGMALLEPVLLGWHLLRPGKKAASGAAGIGSLDA